MRPSVLPIEPVLYDAMRCVLSARHPHNATEETDRLLEARQSWGFSSIQLGPAVLQYENLRPEDMNLGLIARGLSRTCRWSGQVRDFYSVAAHSIYVASMLPGRLQLAGLLHDATEAFLGDVPTPLKVSDAYATYRDVEKWIDALVRIQYEIYLTPEEQLAVDAADRQALVDEAHHLLAWPPRDDWHLQYGTPTPEPELITGRSCDRIEDRFLQTASPHLSRVAYRASA